MTTRYRSIAVVATIALAVCTMQSPAAAKTVSPSTWSTKFCTTLHQWETKLTDDAHQVESALGSITGLTDARARLTSFLGQMVTATGDAQKSLKRAGAPDTTNGQKIADAFVNGLGHAKSILARANSDAAGLSTTDPAAFASQAKSIGTDLTDSSDQLNKSFTGVDTLDKGGKLSAVLKKTKACAFLVNG
jgi:hypothetical protein